MIVHITPQSLLRYNNSLEENNKHACYTEIIISYLFTYMINDDSEYEFEFNGEFNEKIIEKTTENIRDIFPNYFVMNYTVSKLDCKIIKQGITIDKKN